MIKLTVQNDNLFSHVLHQSFLILVFKLLTTNQFSDKFGYIPTVQLKMCLPMQHLKLKIILSVWKISPPLPKRTPNAIL